VASDEMKLAAFNKTKIKFCTTKKMKNTHTFATNASVHGGMSTGGENGGRGANSHLIYATK